MSTIHSPDYDLLARFPETDNEPVESTWHRDQMNLLVDLTRFHHRDRDDYYVAGNLFVYWDPNDPRKSSGPDYMFVRDVPRWPERHIWAVWREEDRFPDMIVELMSPRTKNKDRKTNKTKYEQVFHTPEYFYYDPATGEFQGWRLADDRYHAIPPDARGWFWSEQLRLWLGTWYGTVDGREETVWLRFYDADGLLVPMPSEAANERAEIADERAEAAVERAEAEYQRAKTERERRESAEAEIARLRALLDRPSEQEN